MKMVQCAIIFDGNNDNLKSGETISGFIELTDSNGKTFRHLHVTIEGIGEVRWPSLTFSENTLYSTFSNVENYFKETIHIFDYNDPLGMAEEVAVHGSHKFPFTYQLSSALPSSFEGKFGYIHYTVTAVLDILNDETITIVRPFKITSRHNSIRPYDAENYPFRAELSTTFTYCLFPRPLCVVMTIPHTEFIVGEAVPVTVELVNRSFADVREIIMEFVQVVCYKSKTPRENFRTDETVLTKVSKPSIGRKQLEVFTTTLKIPSFIPPTQHKASQIIEIHYKIQVRLDARLLKIISLQPSLTLPIMVGIESMNQHRNHPEK